MQLFRHIHWCTISKPLISHESAVAWLEANTEDLDKSELMEGAGLWGDFAEGRLESICNKSRILTGGVDRLGLDEVLSVIRRVFPRVNRHNELQLSELDEGIFNAVRHARWKNAAHIVGQIEKNSDDFGLQVLFCRLLDWSDHNLLPPALECQMLDTRASNWSRTMFRLSSIGESLLENGITRFTEALRFPIGGTVAYDDEHKWVVLENGELVRQ
ncbi:MAG: hypothetical protein ACK526_02635 [Planctomyces sp.]